MLLEVVYEATENVGIPMRLIWQDCRHMSALAAVPWGKREQVAVFSVLGFWEVTAEDDLSAEYWVANIVSCVRFSDALAHLCIGRIGGLEETVDVLVGPATMDAFL